MQQNVKRAATAAPYIGVSKATFYRLLKEDPKFPKGIRVSARCVVWKVSDLDEWISSKSEEAH